MDTLDPRRRRHSTLGLNGEVAVTESEPQSETALSHGHPVPGSRLDTQATGEKTPVQARVGPAISGSPNTMERGLVASPFHSERVQEEVQLRRSRPQTLDQDGRAIIRARIDAGDVELHPDYGSGSSFPAGLGEARGHEPEGYGGKGIRVARVQAEETEGESRPPFSSGMLPSETPGLGRSTIGTEGVPLLNDTGTSARNESEVASLEERRSPGAVAPSLELEDSKPSAADTRELVPAMPPQMQQLLIQMMEENRSLRMRLEHTESASSWHSQATRIMPPERPLPDMAVQSPMSFAPGTGPRGLEVQSQGRGAIEDLQEAGVSNSREVGREVSTTDATRVLRPATTAPGWELGPVASSMRLFAGFGDNGAGWYGGEAQVIDWARYAPPREGGPVPPRVPPIPIPSHGGAPDNRGRDYDVGAVLPGLGRVGGCEGIREASGPGSGGGNSNEVRFHTPRSMAREGSSMGGGFDSRGYPVSPGGTVIMPPPGPPPMSPRLEPQGFKGLMDGGSLEVGRPEEPAKYIHELPKLQSPELATSAVCCGNWLAQVRQVLVGLSPSASVWWSLVEAAATMQYQRWLVADPLDRLLLDPSGVYADFSAAKYQRVESRAVSLILAAIPGHIRDEAVSNRWLSTSSLIFRIMCLYQPGGASERSMLLSQLVSPEGSKNLASGVAMLRRWQQHFSRVRELQAALPDSSLLLRGIDNATAGLLAQYPSLGFRVNAFRNKVSLDYNPSVTTVLQLVRLLQAEFEAASLSVDQGGLEKKARLAVAQFHQEPVPKGPPPKVPPPPPAPEALAKFLESEGQGKAKGKGKDKGKVAGSEPNACYNFAEGKGCKFGDSCKFKHDRLAARRQKRCLACGQEGHFRPECPLVPAEHRQVRVPEGSSVPKAVPPKEVGHPKAKAKSAPVLKGVTEEIPTSGQAAGSSEGSDLQVQEALLAEAAKLLKGVVLKPLRTGEDLVPARGARVYDGDFGWLCSAIANASDSRFALVDSGATNALRQAKWGEIEVSRVIKVDLASGATELHVNKHGTLLSQSACQVIIPAGYLVQLGYTITWKHKGCLIRRGRAETLSVEVVKGCPLILKEKGLEILDEYESRLEKGEVYMLKPSWVGPAGVTQSTVRRWLQLKMAKGSLTREDQLTWLKTMFPEAPLDYLNRAAGEDVDTSPISLEGSPWNRRMRRSVLRSRRGEVLIHLFAGQQKWKCNGLVVEVEKARGSDLMCPGVWQQLLAWAMKGVVGGVIGGPPCRTVSCCRNQHDGGPPPVRGRVQSRWGLPGLPGHLHDVVRGDSVLWLRFLLLYAVAQASADVGSEIALQTDVEGSTGRNTKDSWRRVAGNGDRQAAVCAAPPMEGKDPLQLAKWALQQAAARMGSAQSQLMLAEDSRKEIVDRSSQGSSFTVFFGWEHPSDPKKYMSQSKAPVDDWASWWTFPEWRDFARVYSVYEAHFDQGKLGHERPKPTTFATTSWALYEMLDQQCLTEEERAWFGKGPSVVRQRVHQTSLWSAWAPGLTERVLKAWHLWGKENGLWTEVYVRQAMLRRLTEEEAIRRHEANDHMPFRRGCPICVAAQGRQRSHWRASVTGVFSISVDIAGPFKPGQCWDPVASGRDRGLGYKYFLAQEAAGLELPAMHDLFGEAEPALRLMHPGPEPALKVVEHRFKEKGPEPEGPKPAGQDPPLPPPAEEPPDSHVQTRTLFLAVPLRTRKGKEVLAAVQLLVNRLETWGFPVHRYHADRAKELRSAALVQWLRTQAIHATWTAGESPAGNKAELAVQNIKGGARKLLLAGDLPSDLWPFAVLHVSSRNWSLTCEALGLPVPPLLAFGQVLQARKRLKHSDSSGWTTKTLHGKYLGQAPSTPGGHLVWVEDKVGGHRVLLTNTVYPLRPAAVPAVKPKYRLRHKSSPDFVLRAIRALPLPVSRLSPGGEWGNTWGNTESGEDSLDEDDHQNLDETSIYLKERSQLEDSKAARSLLLSLADTEEGLLRRRPNPGVFEGERMLSVLRDWQGRGEEGLEVFGPWDFHVVLGMGVGGSGISSFTWKFPGLTRFLNGMIGAQNLDLSWTSLHVSRNSPMPFEYEGVEEPDSRVWLVALGEFQGGGLWIESETGEGPVVRHIPGQGMRAGHVTGIRGLPVCFESWRRHTVEPWMGGDMWIVKAFTARIGIPKGSKAWDELGTLGFRGTEPPDDTQGLEQSLGYDGNSLKEDSSLEESEWEVDFPHVVCSEEFQEACRFWHRVVTQYQSKLQGFIASDKLDLEGLVRTSEDLKLVVSQRSWFEFVLEQGGVQGVLACVRSLAPEVPLREPESNPAEQFLQTRTVSLEEARQELDLWKSPGEEELTALEVTTEAVERITSSAVEEWVRRGRKVIQVPGKAVLTRKAGVGKRRFRAVCCGNHIPSDQVVDKKSDLYAGGVDALTVRVVLAYTAQQRGWDSCIVDVKTAFLYAPVRTSQEGVKEAPVIVVKPPYFLVQLGLLKSTDRWRVRRALYGLQTSPRDWSEYRDKELRSIQLMNPEGARLHQGVTDESLWFIKSKGGFVLGLMIVYVDDIALFGPRGIVEEVVNSLKQKWRLSEPAWASPNEPVMFCGMELTKATYGWRVTQKRYLQEIIARYQVQGSAQAPLPKWEEPPEETPGLEEVRRAQAITGALLWSVTRSRPDMVFVVSQMAQLSTKTPRRVYEMGIQALKYASGTLDLGLEFRRVDEPFFGSEGQLSHSRSSNALEIYADASHSPNGERSRQCVFVIWKGAAILWEATRQPFTALSTAEAELIGMVHAAQVGECVGPIIEELVQEDVVMSLLGDNSAALASYEQGSGTWRNRHLRMRASAGRERVQAGVLFPSHVPGHLQVADVGTKPLPATKLLGLLALVNVRMPMESSVTPTTAKFFARVGGMSLSSSVAVSPAVTMLLAVLSQLPRADSSKTPRGGTISLVMYAGVQQAVAQPDQDAGFRWDTLRWVAIWLVLLLLFGLAGLVWRECGVVVGVEPVSPRQRREQASSSWEGGPSASESEPGEVLLRETGPLESPSSRLEGDARERVEPPIGQAGSEEEPCVFPMIGRMNPLANWVPMHYVRGLLSLVGGLMFQYLGVDKAEVVRLREVGRTFRYGVAFAYERAKGARLFGTPRGITGGHGLAHARAEVPEDPEDDPGIDEVRHVDPREEWGPMPQDLHLGAEVASISSSEPVGSLESTSIESTGVDSEEGSGLEQVSSAGVSNLEAHSGREGNNPEGGVSYRAVDGALIVIYMGNELRVELPNWSFEEVHSIVRSIQLGDWSSFHEVVTWGSSHVGWSMSSASSCNQGIPPGEIAVGLGDSQASREDETLPADGRETPTFELQQSEGQGERPLGEGDAGESRRECCAFEGDTYTWWFRALELIGWTGWMILWWCNLVGSVVLLCLLLKTVCRLIGGIGSAGEAEEQMELACEAWKLHAMGIWESLSTFPGFLGMAWMLSIGHRTWVLLRGLNTRPCRVHLSLSSALRQVTVPLGGNGWRWVWLFLVVLFGLVRLDGASEVQERDSVAGTIDGQETSNLVPYVESVCTAGQAVVERGRSVVTETVKICSIVALWEILKLVHRRVRKRTRTAMSQTSSMGIVPMPLAGGVPHRANILFSLWRAGYEVPIEPYPEEVQDCFHGYVGEFLRVAARDEDLSE